MRGNAQPIRCSPERASACVPSSTRTCRTPRSADVSPRPTNASAVAPTWRRRPDMHSLCQPLVSVVMATCDRAHFLGPSIDSVLKQSAGDLELIVADDGSGEPARRVLRAWESDPRVHVMWLPHLGIPGAVRNAALHAARGRYVAFQDSDDVWLPDKLSSQLAALAATPGARWCYTSCEHIDARGAPIAPRHISAWSSHDGDIRDAVACLRTHAALPTVLVERELLQKAGFFDEQLRLFEDHDLWLRLA